MTTPARLKLEHVKGRVDAQRPPTVLRPVLGSAPACYTIKDVSETCGLPGPVIAQLVPRTWVHGVGWMYTEEQVRVSAGLAENLRRFLAWSKAGVSVRCEVCGAEPADAVDAAHWELRGDPEPHGFCRSHRP